MIFGHGPEVSPLMIVTDYPTADEIKNGSILGGGATAKSIDNFLRVNKWSLAKCYKTAYIKKQMPGFASKDKKKSNEILEATLAEQNWAAILRQEIVDINPHVILSLGELPLGLLTGHKKIHNFRGSILPVNPVFLENPKLRIVPTLHPRDTFTNQVAEVYVNLDYAKAIRQIGNISDYKEEGNLWICKTSGALIEWWKRARHAEFITVDIETQYNFIDCMGFSHDGKEALSIPMLDEHMSSAEKMCIYRKIDEILRSKVPKVNQNMKYDWTVLEQKGLDVNNIIGDTMLMAHTCYPELLKNLGFLTSIYTDIPYFKDEGKEYDARIHDYSRRLIYNAKDCLATWQIWEKQLKDAEELKVKHFYFNVVQPLFFHYKKVDAHGIRIDELKRQELEKKYIDIAWDNSATLNAIYGKDLNLNSPTQVASFLYDFLACPKHFHKNDKGEMVLSTGEEVIEEIYLNEITDDTRKMLLKQVILGRKVHKVIQFLQTPYSYFDQRMRTSHKLQGTENGRSSTSEAIGWFYRFEKGKAKSVNYGTGFQIVPKHGFKFEDQTYGADLREIFVPSPGKIFIDADGSNAEGRVVCVLSEDWDTLDYMQAGNDLHKLTASWILMMPVERVLDKSFERNLGKTARHAGNLGQGPHGLSILIHKPVSFTKQVMTRFHEKAPKIQEVFHATVEKLLRNRIPFFSPHGRRRDFFGKIDSHILKAGFSFFPQSTVGDHYKIASLRIAERAPYADQFFEAHDGLAWEIDYERKEEFIPIVYEEMRKPIDFRNCTMSREYDLVIPCEIGRCEPDGNWKSMKDYKDAEIQEIINKYDSCKV